MGLRALALRLVQVVSSLSLRASDAATYASGVTPVTVYIIEPALTLLWLTLALALTSLVGLLALNASATALHALPHTHPSSYTVIDILWHVRLVRRLR